MSANYRSKNDRSFRRAKKRANCATHSRIIRASAAVHCPSNSTGAEGGLKHLPCARPISIPRGLAQGRCWGRPRSVALHPPSISRTQFYPLISPKSPFFLVPPAKNTPCVVFQKISKFLLCSALELVGLAGFEPAASSSRTKRSTKLSHSPTFPVRESPPYQAALACQDLSLPPARVKAAL